MKLIVAFTALSISLQAFGSDVVLPKEVQALHTAMGKDCDPDAINEMYKVESYPLGKEHQLFLVPCSQGAYQGSARGYIMNNRLLNVEPVIVLSHEDGIVASMDLTEASFDPKSSTLGTFAKGRGLADCGQSSKTRFKPTEYNVQYKTIEIRSKPKCDGKYVENWPVVFKQK